MRRSFIEVKGEGGSAQRKFIFMSFISDFKSCFQFYEGGSH